MSETRALVKATLDDIPGNIVPYGRVWVYRVEPTIRKTIREGGWFKTVKRRRRVGYVVISYSFNETCAFYFTRKGERIWSGYVKHGPQLTECLADVIADLGIDLTETERRQHNDTG